MKQVFSRRVTVRRTAGKEEHSMNIRGKHTTKAVIAAAITGFLTFTTMSSADGRTSELSDEKKLSTEIMMLNQDAKMPDGERITTDQLSKEFNVPNEKISAFVSKNFDYGEIATILGIANKMSGGVNDANINRIMDLRKDAPGWQQVAANLNVDLEDIAKTVGKIEDNTHREIKRAGAGQSGTGRAAGGTPSTRNERDVGTGGADY
jgi:hypothetical protein